MKNRSLRFSALREFLKSLDFVETIVPGSHIVFEHASSNTIFPFRLYRATENVNPRDLAMVRFFLDARGLLAEEEFDSAVSKALAHHN